jgi:hypothetical protein
VRGVLTIVSKTRSYGLILIGIRPEGLVQNIEEDDDDDDDDDETLPS